MFSCKILFTTLVLAALPASAVAQFADTFNTINSAWVPDRFDPAGFTAVSFLGDNRLQLTIQPPAQTNPFQNTQGRQRTTDITGLWSVSSQVFVDATFNTTTGPLVRTDIWANTVTLDSYGAAIDGDYAIFGFTNASPTVPSSSDLATLLTAADRSFRFRAWSGSTGWVDLGVPTGFTFDAWHTITATSTGTAFEFRLDGVLLLTNSTTAANNLVSVTLQAANFGGAGYSVYWDNVSATAIPEPATSALLGALAVLGLAVHLRRGR
jgi:hypothetical protein